MTGPAPTTARTAATVSGLLAIVAASLWLRWPGFSQGGFASHDVAGILYNAMVLDGGGLPYVDTFELKAPGSFFLARLFAGPEARDIARFQIWANAWALLGLVAVAGLGWRLWGRVGGLVSAGLYALHDANLDSMDANYVTWANLPQIVGFALGIEAGRARTPGRRAALWLSAGAAAGFAALCKRPEGVILPVLLLMAAIGAGAGAGAGAGPEVEGWRGRWRAPTWVGSGFALAHAPIIALYAGRGQLGALIDGYFLNRWGLRYLGAREVDRLHELGEGLQAAAHFVGLPLCLAAFAGALALGDRLLSRRGEAARLDLRMRRELGFVALWALGTGVAASLGLRFYKGYFLATAAPLCLLAAAPWGLAGAAWRLRGWLQRGARVAALLLLTTLLLRQVLILEAVRRDRAMPHDLGGRRIAEHLLAHTEPDDRIWVWGWHLWDVYPLTGRRSASRIYKSLGILTQPNDDTWRRPAKPLGFVDSPDATALLLELEAAPPAYIVLGSTVPHRAFTGLQDFLRDHYRRDYAAPRIGKVEFWRRKD